MICPKCGFEMENSVCPNCGKNISEFIQQTDEKMIDDIHDKEYAQPEELPQSETNDEAQQKPQSTVLESSDDKLENSDDKEIVGQMEEEPQSEEKQENINDFAINETSKLIDSQKRSKRSDNKNKKSKKISAIKRKKVKTVTRRWDAEKMLEKIKNEQRKNQQIKSSILYNNPVKKNRKASIWGIFKIFPLFRKKHPLLTAKEGILSRKRAKGSSLLWLIAGSIVFIIIFIILISSIGGAGKDQSLFFIKNEEVYSVEPGSSKSEYLMGDIQLGTEIDEADYPVEGRYFTNNAGDITYYLSDIKSEDSMIVSGILQAKRKGAVESVILDNNVIAGKIFLSNDYSTLFYYKNAELLDNVLYATLMKVQGDKTSVVAEKVVVDTVAASPDGKIVRYTKNVTGSDTNVTFESYLLREGQKEEKQQDNRRPLVQFSQSNIYVYAQQGANNHLEIYFAQGDTTTKILTSSTNDIRNIMIVSDFSKNAVLAATLQEKDLYSYRAGGKLDRIDTSVSTLIYDEAKLDKVTEYMPGSLYTGFLSAEIADSLAYIKNSNLYYRYSNGQRITIETNVSSAVLRDNIFVFTHANTTGNVSLYAKRQDQTNGGNEILLAENVKIGSQQIISDGTVLCLTQYSASQGDLSAIKISNSESKLIVLDSNVYDMCYHRSSGKVVYIKNYAQNAGELCSININGTSGKTIDTGVTAFYDAAQGNRIFYTKVTQNEAYDLYMVNISDLKPVSIEKDTEKVFLPQN